MPFLDNKTITVLNITYPSVKNILEFCGRSKKKFIETLIYYNFPEYYTDGIICDELDNLIKHFQKKYERKSIDNPLYLNWDKSDPIDMRTATLLNITLGSGAPDFVEILICSSLKTAISADVEIRSISVESNSKIHNTANLDLKENTTDTVTLETESSEEISFEKITESQFDD